MKIRKGKLSDLEELYKILNNTPELYGGSYEKDAYSKEEIKENLKGRKTDFVLIAEEEGRRMIGFLLAEISKKRKYSYLENLYVKQNYRKKGVASKLMEIYEDECKKKKIKEITLLTLKTNKDMNLFLINKNYRRGKELILFDKRLVE